VDRLRPVVVYSLIGLALAGLLAYTVHTLVPDQGPLAAFFDRRVYYALVVGAFAICSLRVVLVPDRRLAWGFVAAGVGFYAAGDLYWEVALSGLDEAPFPSPADACYLAYFPCIYVGLFLLVRTRLRGARSVWLDGLTAALGAGAVAAAVLVPVILDSTGGRIAVVATNLAYPAGDLLLLTLLCGVVAVGGATVERSTLLLAGALTLGAVADSVYLVQVAQGAYAEGTLLDALWPAAMLCVAIAAWSDGSVADRRPAHSRPLLLVPMASGVAACGVLLASGWLDVSPVAVGLGSATIGAVLVRLWLTFAENRRLLELTRAEALTDALTGLPNRRALVRDLDKACASLADGGTSLLALFDLDGFKFYNDTFGHPAGDALLARLGGRLAAVCHPAGSVYRLGGDEFCLLTRATVPEAARLLDAAVGALSDHGEGFSVTSSFGAVFLPSDASEPSGALKLADSRLYAQKYQRQAGRDRAHEALLQALYEREPAIADHLRRVVDLSLAVGRELAMSPAELEQLERAALLHDIGKLAVPDEVLHKPGELTEDELRFIRQHTVVGERILAAAPALRGVGAIVRSTHERWDGTGYPDGLAAEGIPLAARVIAACDAYTAMRESRPYSTSCSHADALQTLRRNAGSQFDAVVVEALTRLRESRRADELNPER
jgi:two-component system cell cycle response regulator